LQIRNSSLTFDSTTIGSFATTSRTIPANLLEIPFAVFFS
jgi:hypothetical protein